MIVTSVRKKISHIAQFFEIYFTRNLKILMPKAIKLMPSPVI